MYARALFAFCLLFFVATVTAEDEHEIDFHVQGGSFDKKEVRKQPGKTLITLATREPITKAEAEQALDKLLDQIRTLRTNNEITAGDFEIAETLIPKMKDWVNKVKGSGIATGKSHSIEDGNIRVDCEPHKGRVLVDNLPHSFVLTATAWDKTVGRPWKKEDSPGRKVGREELEALKSDAFKEWDLDPSKTTDLKVRATLAAWKDAREWFEGVILREGVIEGDGPKNKEVTKEEKDGPNKARVTLKLEIEMLNGIGFVEED